MTSADSPDTTGAPDVIIAGGMKCGSSTLHRSLEQHPDVWMASGEQYLLDMDDRNVHPEFPPFNSQVSEPDLLRYLRSEYRRRFTSSADVTGERSTTYLYSRKTPVRIRKLFPDARVIILLRNPVKRAYSHYWHRIRTGRETLTFDQRIRSPGSVVLKRGDYREAIERYLDRFPNDQLMILVFERFVDQFSTVIKEVLEFLDLPSVDDPDNLRQKGNEGRVPLSVSLQLKYNQLSRRLVPYRYQDVRPGTNPDFLRKGLFLIDSGVRRLWNVRWKSRPEMSDDARAFLRDHYRRTNNGLSQLIGRNLDDYWPFLA
jgi:hypothetical protein